MLFGEDVPLCQCDVFSYCLTARLCAASQDRQTDRQDISDVFTICSGRTEMMGRDEKERHLFSQRMKRWMVSEDLLPDIYCYQLSQRSGKRRAPCDTLSTLTWNKGQRWSVIVGPRGARDIVEFETAENILSLFLSWEIIHPNRMCEKHPQAVVFKLLWGMCDAWGERSTWPKNSGKWRRAIRTLGGVW